MEIHYYSLINVPTPLLFSSKLVPISLFDVTSVLTIPTYFIKNCSINQTKLFALCCSIQNKDLNISGVYLT